jgi:branched-chain amino acid transport system permease protein
MPSPAQAALLPGLASDRADRPPMWTFPLRAFWPLAVGIAVAAVLLLLSRQAWFGGFRANLLLLAGINIIAAVSLTIVNGFTGQFSIGHAGFMGVGGYAASAVMYYGSLRKYGTTDFHGGWLSFTGNPADMPAQLLGSGDGLFLIAILVGGLVAAVIGYIVGLPSLRLRGDYLAIVTLGFGEIARVIIQGSWAQIDSFETEQLATTPWYKMAFSLGGALGFNGTPTYTTIFWVWLFVAIMLTCAIRLKYSGYGRALLSVREDEVAAQAMGVPIAKYKVRAFAFSAFFAGIAGGLLALANGAITPTDLGFQQSFNIVIMVVLGGMGSISGAMIAAMVLTVLPEMLRFVNEYRMIVYALALVLMMIVRPKGLLGMREVWDFVPRRRARGKA